MYKQKGYSATDAQKESCIMAWAYRGTNEDTQTTV